LDAKENVQQVKVNPALEQVVTNQLIGVSKEFKDVFT
jgi:hypothetical protein